MFVWRPWQTKLMLEHEGNGANRMQTLTWFYNILFPVMCRKMNHMKPQSILADIQIMSILLPWVELFAKHGFADEVMWCGIKICCFALQKKLEGDWCSMVQKVAGCHNIYTIYFLYNIATDLANFLSFSFFIRRQYIIKDNNLRNRQRYVSLTVNLL